MSSMLHGCLADTDYFELTAQSGRSYGIWVTTPPGYAESTEPLPLIYVLDGNGAVGFTAPLVTVQTDPYLTLAPYIQVSIGYAGEAAEHWVQLRNRDFVPPGEPVSDDMVPALEAARDSGAMSQQEMDAFLAELTDTRADLFLDFLTDDLHPHLQSRFRVADSGHGLFGYSYGGLFALYAWLRDAAPFSAVGAGSPGVLTPDSRIFAMIDALPARPADPLAPRLHITVNELEALGDIAFPRRLAQNVLDVVDRLLRTDRAPDVTRALLRETHSTGLQASFLDYLKVCHSRPA
ncbi:alpha/beta hydrolase [Pseudonocardia sp. HH130630-07]|uniref:alpha/beta hydrolase n=1 Tax=Pseudonocardia sp. HH130630-07 TaxID=1690815 RepID=UPI000815394C|nr:alpha/beta hydrolase-fold protein [Pseudonocardia sp. HH130630-07]ANY08206.1 esterase [Pseudonocardia sp. HH130630-07]